MKKTLIAFIMSLCAYMLPAQERPEVTGDKVTFSKKSEAITLSPDSFDFVYFTFDQYLINQIPEAMYPGTEIYRNPVMNLTDTTCKSRLQTAVGKIYKAGSIDKQTTFGDILTNAKKEGLYKEYCLRDACDMVVQLIKSSELQPNTSAYLLIKEPSVFTDGGYYLMDVYCYKQKDHKEMSLIVTFTTVYASYHWKHFSPYFIFS
jgi:hypothetical protein